MAILGHRARFGVFFTCECLRNLVLDVRVSKEEEFSSRFVESISAVKIETRLHTIGATAIED